MSRSIIIGSAVFGLVIAIGLLLIPFSVPGVGESTQDVSCGNLIAHYLDGSTDSLCDSAATNRRLSVFAGFFLAAISSGVLRRAKPKPSSRTGAE